MVNDDNLSLQINIGNLVEFTFSGMVDQERNLKFVSIIFGTIWNDESTTIIHSEFFQTPFSSHMGIRSRIDLWISRFRSRISEFIELQYDETDGIS